jgi:hypothetical protein
MLCIKGIPQEYFVKLVIFDTPVKTLIERARKTKRVDDDYIYNSFDSFYHDQPTEEETETYYDDVTYLLGGDND